jgi:hypothetical protein
MDAVHAGRKIRCSGCGKLLVVPQPADDQGESPKPAEPQTPPFWTPTTLLILGILLGLAIFMFALGNVVTRIFVVLIVCTTLHGCWLGASRVAAAIIGMLAALVLAAPVGKALEGMCASVAGLSGLANRLLSIGVAGVLVIIVVSTVISFPLTRMMRKRPLWRRCDRVIGGGLGMVEGAILGMLVIWTILVAEPILARNLAEANRPGSNLRPHRMSGALVSAAQVARESAVGRAIGASNPLKEMRIITLLHDAQTVLTNQRSREAFLNHPAIAQLRHRESVQRVVDTLAAEAQLVNLEDGLSAQEVRALLESPKLLAALDETNLLAELSPMADQIEKAMNDSLQAAP